MITHYCKMGIVPVDANKRITLGGAMQGIVSHLRQLRSKTHATSTAHSRLQEARARELNLRIAQRENRLIDVDEIDQLSTVAFTNLRIRLSGIPNRVTRDPNLRHNIEMEINDAMAELSDFFLAEAERLKNMAEAERRTDREKRAKFEEELAADVDLQ